MANHAKDRSKIAAVTNWAAAALAAILVFGVGCVAGYQAQDSFGQPPFWIIFGGNTDTGNGSGGGAARDQMIAGGWTSPERSFQVTYQANTGEPRGTRGSAVGPGDEAYWKYCSNGCIIAGFSQGAVEAIELRERVGAPPGNLYLFGAPQPESGIWHHPVLENPNVEVWIKLYGFRDNIPVPAGANAFYDTRDPYANAAPQCVGPGLFALTLDGHYIVPADAAFNNWVDANGVNMHEVGYQPAPGGLPRSGSDPSQPWDLCPFNDWHDHESLPPGLPPGSVPPPATEAPNPPA